VTPAQPGYVSFNVVPPFWFCDELANTSISEAFVVDADGVLRTNIYLRHSWSGHRFHFRATVRRATPHGDLVTGQVADVTVCHKF